VAIRKLVFVRRSRAFGFSIEECRELLDLYQDQDRTSSEVKRIASKRLQEIENKQRELQSLHDELAHLVISCRGDHMPNCPIIDYLG
jgi:DNA-binding transcriptional MerR regulator